MERVGQIPQILLYKLWGCQMVDRVLITKSLALGSGFSDRLLDTVSFEHGSAAGAVLRLHQSTYVSVDVASDDLDKALRISEMEIAGLLNFKPESPVQLYFPRKHKLYLLRLTTSHSRCASISSIDGDR